MSSRAKAKYDKNKKDLERLWEIHTTLGGQAPGARHGLEVLNKAAIVFATACWEAFAEDLAKEAFEFLLKHAKTADAIPIKVRTSAMQPILDQEDVRKLWDIADSGWRTVLESHKQIVFQKWIDDFHSPRPARINALFADLIGVSKVSAAWSWQKMPVTQAETKLDEYIDIRGKIAHGNLHGEAVHKNWGEQYLNHLDKLVMKTEQAVVKHLKDRVATEPW